MLQKWEWFGLRMICPDYKKIFVLSEEVVTILRRNSQSKMIDLYQIRGDITDIRRQLKQDSQALKDKVMKLEGDNQALKDDVTMLKANIHYREVLKTLETTIVRNPLQGLSTEMYKYGSFKNAFFELNIARKWIVNDEETNKYKEKYKQRILPEAVEKLEESFNEYFFKEPEAVPYPNLKELLMDLCLIDKEDFVGTFHPRNIDQQLVAYALENERKRLQEPKPPADIEHNPMKRRFYYNKLNSYRKNLPSMKKSIIVQELMFNRFASSICYLADE